MVVGNPIFLVGFAERQKELGCRQIVGQRSIIVHEFANLMMECEVGRSVTPMLMNQQHFDAILLDMNFGPGESSGKQGFLWLKKILEIDPQSVCVPWVSPPNDQ